MMPLRLVLTLSLAAPCPGPGSLLLGVDTAVCWNLARAWMYQVGE